MEQTKIYAVEVNSGFCMGTSIVGFCLSKEDAEYKAWSLNRDSSPYSRSYCRMIEITPLDITKDSSKYKKFIKERQDKIKRDIETLESCKEKDIKKIEELKSDLEMLTK